MQILDIEQGSEAWRVARAGMPTASEFKRMITSQGEPSKQMADYAAHLAAELYAGKPLDRWEGNQWTERGHEIEAEARAAYEFFSGVSVAQVGFITNHGAGCSPDGLAADHLVEIKCLSAKVHVQTLAYHAKHGRCPPDYIPQARGQMLLCDKPVVNMYFYHPDLPPLCVAIERDETFETALLYQIKATLAERDRFVDIIRGAA